MVEVNGFSKSSYFLRNLPDLQFNGASGDCTVTIYFGGTEFASEVYSPANGKFTVRGIADLIEPYMVKIDPQSDGSTRNFSGREYLFISVSGGLNTNTSAYVFKAKEKIDCGEKNMFLSRFKSRTVGEHQVMCFAFNGEQGYDYAIETRTAYKHNGVDAYESKKQSLGQIMDRTVVMCGSPYWSRWTTERGVTPKDIIYIEVALWRGGEEMDTMRFVIDHTQRKNENIFLFENLFGVPESVRFAGKETTSLEKEGEILMMNGVKSNVEEDAGVVLSLNSGYINIDEFNTIKDMLRCSAIYKYDWQSRAFEQYYVESVEVADAVKPASEPYAVELKVRSCEKYEGSFARELEKRRGLFDIEFSEVYD